MGDISFTFGDSMALYYTGKLEHEEEQVSYIEAQLWNNKYLKEFE